MPTGLDPVRVAGNWPEIAGTCRGTLLLAGGARCVWDDLAKVPDNGADIMCVNDVGLRFPGHIEHWYSNHTDQLAPLVSLRNMGASGRTWGPKYTHSVVNAPNSAGADIVWPLQMRGNSGLTAILVALALGYDRIIVCGIPLDDTGHFLDPPEGHWLQGKARGFSHPVKWSNFSGEGYARVRAADEASAYGGKVVWASTL